MNIQTLVVCLIAGTVFAAVCPNALVATSANGGTVAQAVLAGLRPASDAGLGNTYTAVAGGLKPVSALLYLAAGLVGTLLKYVRRGRKPKTKTMPSGWGIQ